MSEPTEGLGSARRFAPAGAVFAAFGLALFGYFVWKAGPDKIWEQIAALGFGFLAVLLVSAARPALRTLAWTRCFDSEHTLRFRDAIRAYLIGDALGNVMPLGIVVSEPAKAALVRDRVPLTAAVSALAVENLFYMLSVALFIFAGTAAMLASFPLPKHLRIAAFSTLGVVLVVLTVAFVAVRRKWRPLSRLLAWAGGSNWGRRVVGGRTAKIGAIEERVYGFYERHGARFLPILALEACFHLAGVAEVFVTLYFMLDTVPPPAQLALSAFVLESVNRVINVVFKFVPMRVGVDEAGTGMFTNVLRLGTTAGVTLAIVRKARVIVWTGVGVGLLVRRGLSLRTAAEEAR
ncbi:MAG TPA: lysylphosphatidylglycerol synthase domain-containing protein, partial [Pyrinomonadaceae bacterium]